MLKGYELTAGEKFLEPIHTEEEMFTGVAIERRDQIEDTVYYTLYSEDNFIMDVREEYGSKVISELTEKRELLTGITLIHVREFLLQRGMKTDIFTGMSARTV